MEAKSIIKHILMSKGKSAKELDNYADSISKHDFFEIFPESEYDFSGTDFKEYFYLGKEETKAILNDYFCFVNTAYEFDSFSYEHFLSVVNEFMENLESDNVFFNFKTYYGHKILNNNVEGFVNECQKLLGINLETLHNAKYNTFVYPEQMKNVDKFNFPFFEFLTRKVEGTLISDEFVFEPLLKEDCSKIQNVYENNISLSNAPFYINISDKNFKSYRSQVQSCVLGMLPKEKAWTIVNKTGKEIAIVVISPESDNDVVLNIISDCELDSKLALALEVIKDYVYGTMHAGKIIGKNNNDSIAYSNVATAYALAKFDADYSSAVGDNGLTRMEYTYRLQENDIKELAIKSPIDPISYATFSIYRK